MSVADILEKMGPSTTKELAARIAKSQKCRAAAARQRISRAIRRGDVLYLGHIRLGANSRIVFTKEHRQQGSWEKDVRDALLNAGCAYGHILQYMVRNGGNAHLARSASVCGFPVQNRKGHLSWNSARDNLMRDGIVTETEVAGLGRFLSFFGANPDSQVNLAKFRTEQSLAVLVHEFLKKNGIISYSTGKLRHSGQNAEFAGYGWDITAPTYMMPHATSLKSGGKTPGF